MGTLKRFNLKRLTSDFGATVFVGIGAGQRDNIEWALKSGSPRVTVFVPGADEYRRLMERFAGRESVAIRRRESIGDDLERCAGEPAIILLAGYAPGSGDDVRPDDRGAQDAPARLAPDLGQLFGMRPRHRDVVIIDDARAFIPGEYQQGECPAGLRAWDVESSLRAVLQRFSATHVSLLCNLDRGYIVLLPIAGAGAELPAYLNILAHDGRGEADLIAGVPGATSISIQRRIADARFATRYFAGNGLDVGGGIDALSLYRELFPLITNIVVYDVADGDAQFLENVPDDTFDFLYSSHCLEHVADPFEALGNWIRVVRPGGHLVISVPDEDLYEQRVWPSEFNPDHKHTFTIMKTGSWSPVSVNVLDLVARVSSLAQPLSIQTIDHAYRFKLPRFDQTRTPLAECAIEFVLRKL